MHYASFDTVNYELINCGTGQENSLNREGPIILHPPLVCILMPDSKRVAICIYCNTNNKFSYDMPEPKQIWCNIKVCFIRCMKYILCTHTPFVNDTIHTSFVLFLMNSNSS